MSKIEIPEIYISSSVYNWKLVRERDNLTKKSEKVTWIEWNENGTFKSKHDEPDIGRSLLMSPFNQFFTWQTTPVTKIIENTVDVMKFKTKNSVYTLTRLNDGEQS